MPTAPNRGHRARRRGWIAEVATLWILWAQGWDLVARNLVSGRWEIDLLMTRGDDFRVIEVKARKRGTWTSADMALSYGQRMRIQRVLRGFLDRVPWPGAITFQRVSWAGWRCRFHPIEHWDSLRIPRANIGS